MDVARTLPGLNPETSLHRALGLLASHEGSGVPVLSADGARVIGWLHQRDVMRAYAARLREGTARSAPRFGSEAERGGLADYRVVDLELTDSEAPVGQLVDQLRLPRTARLLALRRDGQVVDVHPQAVLHTGDRLSFLVRAEDADRVADIIRGTAPKGAVAPS